MPAIPDDTLLLLITAVGLAGCLEGCLELVAPTLLVGLGLVGLLMLVAAVTGAAALLATGLE